jgi:dienelactone hydrolase
MAARRTAISDGRFEVPFRLGGGNVEEARMRTLHALALIAILLAAPAAAQMSPEDHALAVARMLADGRFSDLALRFTPDMAAAVPAPRLAQTWQGLVARFGPLRDTGRPRTAQQGAATVVTVPLRFDKVALDLVVTVASDRIAGLVIRPAQAPPQPWTPAAYDKPATYRELEVSVGAAPSLPGTLTLPLAPKQVAAVVLVHGSGPNDRNESLGPNRPFQDIAGGLASRGIAVLRYDKRTRVEPQTFAPTHAFTVHEEVIEDALAAVALLRARPEIDPRRIVVLGHSLGAMLAPRIAGEDAKIAAIIMLAPSARPLGAVVVEQMEYVASLAGPPDAPTRARLDALKAEAARADALKAGDSGPPIMNLPRSYWADLNAYNPAAAAGL